ncbi:MAG: class I SAM-dependent methyltransferase [Candidatus Accumulibacter sp.]|jgi:SAM-dependent methyltransferase|nr:class I SAM-dependent methyltransferase [Accumulibacter sp.]
MTIELEFSRKYDRMHAAEYLRKHRTGLARRLSHWREESIARKALKLAGDPASVLDLPCGAGRFWPLLAERADRTILAADNSVDMLATARAAQPANVVARIDTFQTSAFEIGLETGAVDCVFCIRLLHHIERSEHRLALLRELHRVCRDATVVSLWVDGNYKSWKRRRLETRRARRGEEMQNRFVARRETVEAEFLEAGFQIAAALDFLPGYAMWRTYVLRKPVSRTCAT